MLTLHLPRDLGELEPLLLQLEAYGKQRRWSARLAARVHVAVEELFVNFVTHAMPRPAAIPQFELSIRQVGKVVECVIRDNAEPFDPRRAPPPSQAPLADREEGGVGLALVMRLATALDYETTAGVNTTRLRFACD